MGSWNETCFLTGLPIFSGQPVMLLFIASRYNTWQPGTVPAGSHDTDWQPATLPVKGYYDDYGGIESPEYNEPTVRILRAAQLRVVRGGERGPEPFDTSRFYDREKRDQALQELCGHAARGELEMLVPSRRHAADQWSPCTAVMAHAWAWRHITENGHASDDYLGSVTFRLDVTGPVCLKLREMYSDREPGWTAPMGKAIKDLACLMAGMQAMRLSFHPTAGGGSQDAMDDQWQLDFQKKRFLHAIAIPHRYDECEQAPFSAAAAWDGSNLATDRNENPPEYPELPTNTSPHCLWARILGRCLDNLLSAMSGALHKNE